MQWHLLPTTTKEHLARETDIQLPCFWHVLTKSLNSKNVICLFLFPNDIFLKPIFLSWHLFLHWIALHEMAVHLPITHTCTAHKVFHAEGKSFETNRKQPQMGSSIVVSPMRWLFLPNKFSPAVCSNRNCDGSFLLLFGFTSEQLYFLYTIMQ